MHKSLFLCLVLTTSALHAESRIWTSKDGTSKLTATLHKADADKVTLILANGRTQVVEKKFLSDADIQWLASNDSASPSASTASTNPPSADTATIPAALAGNLIDDRGHAVDLAKRPGGLPEYYLFYYSASWCGYCVQFTPEVVRFAKKLKSSSFSVILVPADRSLEDEIAYLKDYRMPWPGLKWNERGSYPGIPRNPSGGGVPAAALTDASGKILSSTKMFDKRVDFLEAAGKIVLGTAPARASN